MVRFGSGSYKIKECLVNKIAGSAAGYVLVATFLLGFTSCGGGGASGAPGSPSTAVSDSTEASSGSLGVFLSSGNATVAAPTVTISSPGSGGGNSTVTSSSKAYLITLPNAQNSSPSYTAISCSGMSAIGGINLDTQHSVGVAFDTTSPTLEFFTFTGGSPPSVSSTCYYFTLSGSSPIVTSAGQTSVGGVVMDPSIQTAIVETGSGFQFVDYSNPSHPGSSSYPRIPPYSSSSPGGIDLVENFAYDPYLIVGGVSYKMILSGSGAVSYSQADSDGNLLELADIETGTIYRPDGPTQAVFSAGRNGLCTADAIGIDTDYQVAIIGCEYDAFSKPSYPSVFSPVTILVNLNDLVLNASLGTYSLPLSAVVSVTLTNSPPPQNNIFVDSVNHIVMWGSGGDWGNSSANDFSVAKLSDPFTSFGSGIVGGTATLSSLVPPSGGSWVGYGYPHGSAMYVDSSGNSVALWMNHAANLLAMVKANEILAGANPSTAVTYVTIP